MQRLADFEFIQSQHHARLRAVPQNRFSLVVPRKQPALIRRLDPIGVNREANRIHAVQMRRAEADLLMSRQIGGLMHEGERMFAIHRYEGND